MRLLRQEDPETVREYFQLEAPVQKVDAVDADPSESAVSLASDHDDTNESFLMIDESQFKPPTPHFQAAAADETAKNCFHCKRPFTMLYRRHHCRLCGKVFCAGCSNVFIRLDDDQRARADALIGQSTVKRFFSQMVSGVTQGR